MHVAVLASTEHGIEPVLDEAVTAVRGSCGRITIGAVYEPARIYCGIGFPGACIATTHVHDGDHWAVCELGRRLVARLPDDVNAAYAGFLGWRCPELRRFLRSCAADRVMVAGRPLNPFARRTLLRTALPRS